MGRACCRMEEGRSAFKILTGKSIWKKPVRRPRNGWEDRCTSNTSAGKKPGSLTSCSGTVLLTRCVSRQSPAPGACTPQYKLVWRTADTSRIKQIHSSTTSCCNPQNMNKTTRVMFGALYCVAQRPVRWEYWGGDITTYNLFLYRVLIFAHLSVPKALILFFFSALLCRPIPSW